MKTVQRSIGPRLALAMAVLIVLVAVTAGCGRPGEDGRTYLAIDWVYAPQALYFPAFPQTIYAGRYVEHRPGRYAGEYIAWDGSYWIANYRIEIDRGADPPLFGTGDHGDDYYLTLWLFSSGPAIYTDAVVSRSVAAGDASAAAATPALSNETAVADPAIVAARERTRGAKPVVMRITHTHGRYRITVEARGYRE